MSGRGEPERGLNVNDELKPCPFCGGKAMMVNWDADWVECSVCHARSEGFTVYSSKELAKEAWNRRVKVKHA